MQTESKEHHFEQIFLDYQDRKGYWLSSDIQPSWINGKKDALGI